ncbi:MAG: hypothetical protein FWF24_01150 [Alphaproteobacteria bacterium]|nr:hypothetical protein [Alphaproteobacteria bacterium]
MSLKDTYISALETISLVMPAGSAPSDPVNLGGLRLFAIALSSAFTACSLTFQMSPDDGQSWFDLLDQNGQEVTATALPSSCVVLEPKQFACLKHIRIRCGTAQVQGSTMMLVARAV